MDACTKESKVYLIKYKSEVLVMFCYYKALKEQLYKGRIIQRFHSDSREEYIGHEFQFELVEDRIAFIYSTTTSQ